MKKLIISMLLLMFVLTTSCQQPTIETPARIDYEEIRKEVYKAAVDDYIAAWNSENIEAIGQIWANDDDVTVFEGGKRARIKGWDNVKNWYQASFDYMDQIDFKIVDPLIQLTRDGNVAIITYYVDLDFVDPDGNKQNIKPRVVVVKEKRDGQWRNLHGYASFPAEEMTK